jgi:hypothetical protein
VCAFGCNRGPSWAGSLGRSAAIVMNAMRLGSLTIIVTLSLWSASIRADLIQADDPHHGPNSLTLDTVSGLAWLDLPLTVNMSYQQALLATQPDGPFTGFRLATAPEVRSLFFHAGIPDVVWVPTTSPSLQPILSLLDLVGATSFQNGNRATLGITSSTLENARRVLGLNFAYIDGVPGYEFAGMVTYGDTTHFPNVGVWLVTPIPEPEPCVIGTFGALVLLVCHCGLTKARRRRVSTRPSSRGLALDHCTYAIPRVERVHYLPADSCHVRSRAERMDIPGPQGAAVIQLSTVAAGDDTSERS